MDRRKVLSSAALAALTGFLGFPVRAEEHPPVALGEPVPFGPETLRDKAQELASRLYVPASAVPAEWRKLNYDQYRSIWFDERHALWRKSDRPAEVDFFPAGYLFNRPVQINIVEEGQSRPALFDLEVFDKTDKFPDLPAEGMGFSGFRLRGELEKRGVFQEYTVFQGATYFRALARGQVYGLSARGLALGTGSPGGEEFPGFREFWIEAPAPGAPDIVVHALLDSPSVAGAYRFRITPGVTTLMEVESVLFPRIDLSEAGIAAGTSMFLFDETNRARFDDFRDAVHDSDGLLMLNGAGEQIWRPLANPRRLGISYFVDSGTRGFGLMQRARHSRDFGDLEAHYERRPSLWVEPQGSWGPGSVILVEIPADKEIYDNIVAFWRPAAPLRAGQEHRFAYRLYWGSAAPIDGAVAQIENTRSGLRVFEKGRIFTIDYAKHVALGNDPSKIEARVLTRTGEIRNPTVQFNPVTGGMRLAFTLDAPDGSRPEMRAELRRDDVRVSEVWLYRWND
ncbi:glucan biosynthesis protein G [Paracoccus onubensis]|uniref:glucan biosynthesis protein n=1 Tax=Paracoccus onubensis TaxID=1675788 RepID=UPI00272FDB98|nr:glucan biosynthesis protein G [Paracoccus onubensis]MDP0927887.1 glucan biosynthesis protein G [Paracoccus onubensis]